MRLLIWIIFFVTIFTSGCVNLKKNEFKSVIQEGWLAKGTSSLRIKNIDQRGKFLWKHESNTVVDFTNTIGIRMLQLVINNDGVKIKKLKGSSEHYRSFEELSLAYLGLSLTYQDILNYVIYNRKTEVTSSLFSISEIPGLVGWRLKVFYNDYKSKIPKSISLKRESDASEIKILFSSWKTL